MSRRKSSSIGPSLKDNTSVSMEKRLQSISPRKDKAETESVNRFRTKSAMRAQRAHEASFSKVPGHYDASLYYLSPFDKAILKKNNRVMDKTTNLPGHRINYSFNVNMEDDDGSDAPMLGNPNRSMRMGDLDEHHQQRQNRSLGPSQNRLRSALPRKDAIMDRVYFCDGLEE